MRLTRDEFDSLARPIDVGTLHPPVTAVAALASLLAGDEPVVVIGASFRVEERTVWVLTAVTHSSLIRVRASSASKYWSYEQPGKTIERDGEHLEATLWPLFAVRSLNVTRVRHTTQPGDNAGFDWESDWSVALRDGTVLLFPTSGEERYPDSERVAQLMAVIRSHLVTRAGRVLKV